MANAHIEIRVGETVFHTSRATLSESQLFVSQFAQPAQPKSYFVDNDPELFQHILRYLRTKRFPLFWHHTTGHDYVLYEQLLPQAEFYRISKLIDWLSNKKYLGAVTKSMTIFDRRFVGDGQIENMHCYVAQNQHLQITSLKIDARKEYKCPAGIWEHDGGKVGVTCFRTKCHLQGRAVEVMQRVANVEGILTKVEVSNSVLDASMGASEVLVDEKGEKPPSYDAVQQASTGAGPSGHHAATASAQPSAERSTRLTSRSAASAGSSTAAAAAASSGSSFGGILSSFGGSGGSGGGDGGGGGGGGGGGC